MKPLPLTLTPNRSNPRRYVRIVCYRRSRTPHGDFVTPIRYMEDDAGRPSSDILKFRDIAPCDADPEFAAAWAEHVRDQAAAARDARVG